MLPGQRVPKRLLGIMVKEPVAGRVKTRLSPPLTPDEAARLYTVAMQETIERFAAGAVPVVLFYDGSTEYFRQKSGALPLLPQVDGDLGQRMAAALSALLATGCKAAALIGSDCPDLPIEQVETAFAALATHDLVTIPAGDGGYVLVGQSRPCPEIFQEIPWSSHEVLHRTRLRAEQFAFSYCERGRWADIDDHQALIALTNRSPQSATASFIRRNLSHHLTSTE